MLAKARCAGHARCATAGRPAGPRRRRARFSMTCGCKTGGSHAADRARRRSITWCCFLRYSRATSSPTSRSSRLALVFPSRGGGGEQGSAGLRSLGGGAVSPWVLRGLRDGVVSTAWPAKPDAYADSWRGPAVVVDPRPDEAGALGALCPTGAIAATADGALRLDQ